MAKQKRIPVKAKPITSHQLFPAVVALWFGALFGLGSLAVRPSLLESLVIKSRIDLIVSAAAPPLGVTARILMALAMAAVGSALGIAFARALARPKPVQRERKRGASQIDPGEVRYRNRDTHSDFSGARVQAQPEEPGDERAAPVAGVLGGRRRALAIVHEEQSFVPHEMAPLPGGAPQVFDIGAIDLGADPDSADPDSTNPGPPSPVGQNDYAPAANPVALDWSQPAVRPQAALPQQVFQPVEAQPPEAAAPMAEPAHGEPAGQAEAAAADGRQVFGMTPQPLQPEAARQIFGQTAMGDHVSQDFVKAAGFQTSVFDAPEPSPLFASRAAAAPAIPAEQPLAEVAAVPQAYCPPVPESASAPTPVPLAAVPEPEPAAQPRTEIEPEPAAPIPGDLPMDGLAARLAESMARRRAARAGSPAATPAETATQAPVVPDASPPQIESVSIAEIAAAPEADTAPVVPPLAVPQPPAIPQAMRPLDLDGFEEDDFLLSTMLPPRRIAFPAPSPEPEPEPEPSATPAATAPVDEAELTDEPVAEEEYASLLGIAAAAPSLRSGFVRIDEPEPAGDAVEPVVIFPGQATPLSAIQPSPLTEFRRFDAPTSASQGQPVAANQGSPAVDREGAELALRSALANLQRMSGAA